MTDLRQAAQQALKAWMWKQKTKGECGVSFEDPAKFCDLTKLSAYKWTPLYTTPPAAQPEHGDIRALKYRIHELEGEVIGYKRMIEEAALKKLADLGQQIEQEPIGWLDGDETLAEFMHKDLKAAHDRCGSATPREFTIPVYLAPPAAQPEQEPMTEVADRFAHRMALELECVLSDGAYSNKWYKSAMQVLSEYRSAMNEIHEQHSPTFMGE
jgi:hypothetical protein